MRLIKSKKGELAVILSVLVLLAAGAFIAVNEESSITGFVVIGSFCFNNNDSCIDLNGDGRISLADEDIYAQLLLPNQSYIDANPDMYNMADFDNDGNVDQIDFQQCFVPMRDEAVDKYGGVVTCNPPVIDNVTGRIDHFTCTNGCPDLNGDGYVNQEDYNILISNDVWMEDANDTLYPMANLDGEGIIDWRDRDCFVPYLGKIVMCNLPTHANHTSNCPDLIDVTTGTGNDGRVNNTDKTLFEQYKDEQNLEADFNNDGYVDWLDKFIFNQSYNRIVDCNIYHAPWHIGGVDQDYSNTTIDASGSFGGATIAIQGFTTGREGQLAKIRVYLNYSAGTAEDITVDIRPNGTGNAPNMSILIDSSTIPGFTSNASHWETAYFRTPPVLENDTAYFILLSSPGSSAYNWQNNSGNHIYQTFMSTACADLNGDGICDDDDEVIIDSIPDGMTAQGAGNWNTSYDVNNDHIINSTDTDLISSVIAGGVLQRPSVDQSNSPAAGSKTFGNIYYKAQSFNVTNTKLSSVSLYLAAGSIENRWINVEIREDNGSGYPGDTDLVNTIIEGFTNSSFNWYNATFNDSISLTLNTRYFVVVSSPASTSSTAYNWSNGSVYTNGMEFDSANSGIIWTNSTDDFAFKTYSGDPDYNSSYDVDSDGLIDTNDIALVQSAIISYDNNFWTPLVDFNAIFGVYERLRDKTLGFEAYPGKVLSCGLPTYTISCGNGRCDEEYEDFISCPQDCLACNNDSFCAKSENFTGCADCILPPAIPHYFKFNGSTTDFENVADIGNVENAVLEIFPYGKIEFSGVINFTGLDLDTYVDIVYNNISIDISALPELNKSAKITLYNLSFVYPDILRNLNKCPDDVCSYIGYNNDLEFGVSGFDISPITYYSTEELAPDVTGFNGNTTNFSINIIPDIESVSNMVLEKQGIGKIKFLEDINTSKGNYSRDIEISLNGDSGGWVFVNTSADSRLNKSARITLYNLSLYEPRIILENGSDCPVNICTIVSYPYNDNCNNNCTLVFDVTHFTKYQAIEDTTAPQFVNGPIPEIVMKENSYYELVISYYFFDLDNGSLNLNYSYSVVTIPQDKINISFVNTIGGVIANITVFTGWHGYDAFIIFNASDNNISHDPATSGPVPLTVLTNLPPIFTGPIEYSPDPWYEEQSATINLLDYFSDPDGNQLTFNYSFPDPSEDYDNITITIDQSTGIVLLVPDPNWNGKVHIKFNATDGVFTTTSTSKELNIISVNDIPYMLNDIQDIVADEDENITIDLTEYFTDVEDVNQTGNFSLLDFTLVNNPSNFSFTYNRTTGNCTFVPKEDWYGYEYFIIKVTDSDGGYNTSNLFGIYLNSVLDDLRRTNKTFNLTWEEDTILYVNLSDYYYDPDEDLVIYSATNTSPNPNVTIIDLGRYTGELTLEPKANWWGIEWINLSAMDSSSTLWNYTLLTVTNINDAPAWNLTDINISEDTTPPMIDLHNSSYSYDVDNSYNELNYTLISQSNPGLINCSLINNRYINCSKPIANQTGTNILILNLTDPENLSSVGILTINITPVNDAPYFYPILEDKTVNVNTAFSYDIDAYDVENDTLTYYDNATFNINTTTGLITWTPNATQNLSVLITVCDDSMAANNCTNSTFGIGVHNYTNSTFVNSWVNGTFYDGSYDNVSGISISVINISTIIGPIIDVEDSYIYNSTIINSTIDNCNVSDSILQNTVCKDANIDPSDILDSDTTGSTIIDSTIHGSNATYSTIDNSTIMYSNVFNLTSNETTITGNSIIISSTFIDSLVQWFANVTNSRINSSIVRTSNVGNCTIINTNFTGTTAADCTISDGVITTGTITYENGTIYDATANGPKNLTDILNYAPTAVISASATSGTSSLTVNFDAFSSSDPNIPGDLNDILNYTWDFTNDGIVDDIGNSTSYAYGVGTFTAILNVTDRFNESNTDTITITVSSPPSGGGGGGGGRREQCRDYRDNDDDGLIDWPDDPGCTSRYDNSEYDEIEIEACKERWVCGSWGECMPEGRMSRTCSEVNECGTILYKPVMKKDCEYIAPVPVATCYDRIQNQGEEGVDCGGPCSACPEKVIIPEPPEEKSYVWLYTLVAVILLFGVGFAAFKAVKMHQKTQEIEREEEEIEKRKLRRKAIKILKHYISSTSKKGYNKEAIKNELIKDGWKTELIDRAFKKIALKSKKRFLRK